MTQKEVNVSVYSTVYTGYIYFQNAAQETRISPIYHHYYGNEEKLVFTCNTTYNLLLLFQPLENAYYIVKYFIDEVEEKYIQVSTNYHQLILSNTGWSIFNITMTGFDDPDNNNPNDTCLYYYFLAENDNIDLVLIPEGVRIQVKLKPETNNRILFTFPFIYDNSSTFSYINIHFDFTEKTKLSTRITYDKEVRFNQNDYLYKKHEMIITQNRYSLACIENENSYLFLNRLQ